MTGYARADTASAIHPLPNIKVACHNLTASGIVDNELGLKLVKLTRSIPVIMVEHIDEKPIERLVVGGEP